MAQAFSSSQLYAPGGEALSDFRFTGTTVTAAYTNSVIGSGLGTVAPSTAILFFYALCMPYTATLDTFIWEISTAGAAGAVYRFGLYALGGRSAYQTPTKLLWASAEFDGTAVAAVHTLALDPTLTIGPGMFSIALHQGVAASTFRAALAAGVLGVPANATAPQTAMGVTRAYTALADPFSGAVIGQGTSSLPLLGFHYA